MPLPMVCWSQALSAPRSAHLLRSGAAKAHWRLHSRVRSSAAQPSVPPQSAAALSQSAHCTTGHSASPWDSFSSSYPFRTILSLLSIPIIQRRVGFVKGRAQVLQTCHKAANPSRCQQALLPVLLEAERISPRRPMATKPTISAISQPAGIASQIAIMPKCGAKA